MSELYLPYQPHSATSEAAADDIAVAAGALEILVYEFLRYRAEGATDEEIQRRLVLDGSTERPRRVSLVRKGLVVDSGQKRLTASGRLAVVWRAA
jgi:predicted DNA-binding transcriptional regulator